jgi:hypothetical protein
LTSMCFHSAVPNDTEKVRAEHRDPRIRRRGTADLLAGLAVEHLVAAGSSGECRFGRGTGFAD